jgi:lysophospholipase L1-like esterase
MAQQYDATPRTGNDNTGIALSSASGLGGPGVRVVVDDAVATSKAEVLRMLTSVKNQILKNDYPAVAGTPTPGVTFAFPAVQSKMASGQRSQIGIVGDSAVAGWGSGILTGNAAGANAGNPGNYVRAKSWPSQLKNLLVAAGIPCRSDAYFSSQIDTNLTNMQSANPNIVVGSGWVLAVYSLSGTVLQSPNTVTSNTQFTPEIAADKFDILHSANAGLGTILITDEDGLNVSIDCSTNAGAQVINSTGLGMKRTTVSRPVASTKPIQISRSTGGAIYIEGIIPYNSVTPCLELLNMGWPGSRAYGTSGSGIWNIWADPSTMGAITPYNALGALNCDAYIIELGTNDAAASIADADFQTAMTNIATKLKGQAGNNGLNVAVVKCRTTIGSYASYNMTPGYLAALDTITSSLGLSPVINFNTISFVTADRFDGTHLTEQGYGKEAVVARVSLIGS